MTRGAEVVLTLACLPLALLSLACRASAGGTDDPSPVASSLELPPDTSWRTVRAEVLQAGDRAPDFDGIAHTGMRVRLSAFLDAPAIVYFYAGGSPEDLALARSFRDQWLRLHDRASMVLGVSPDDRIVQRDFATAERLPFLLVTDGEGAIARAFGVPVEGGRPARVTFVVGKDGRVTHVLRPKSAEGHGVEVSAALEAAPP